MALRGLKRRDIVKKSSYYVWFLGAQESRGLRGEEYVKPAVRHLVERERETEPLKVTLQVSSKGLKIIQNVRGRNSATAAVTAAGGGGGSESGKNKSTDLVKHFIPDHSITCVMQDAKPNEDVVACILLIYNPVSKCPVHVHAYRCDSVETAAILRQQLQTLVDHPDNQCKFAELEIRLRSKGLLPPKKLLSDGRCVRTESASSSGGSSDKDTYTMDERMTNLYDSLAAELREKLNNKKNDGPILLPPRDYDTTHRMKGRLDNIDQRRCLQKEIVGPYVKGHIATSGKVSEITARSPDSSGKSSGIGSDEAPGSPTHERGMRIQRESSINLDSLGHPVPPAKSVDDGSSSDEEWRANRDPQATGEKDMLLVQSPPHFRRALLLGGARSKFHDRQQAHSPSPMCKPPPPPLPPQFSYALHEKSYNDENSGMRAVSSHHELRDCEQSHPKDPMPMNQKRNVTDHDEHHEKPHESRHYNGRQAPHNNPESEANHHCDSVQINKESQEKPVLKRVHSRDGPRQFRSIPYDDSFTERGKRYNYVTSEQERGPLSPRQSTSEINKEHYDRGHTPEVHQSGNPYSQSRERWHSDPLKYPDTHAHEPTLRSSHPPSSSKHHDADFENPTDPGGYHVPLPRVRRLDSGHSSSMSNANSQGHQHDGIGGPRSYHSPNRKITSNNNTANYQELPNEKRYPGLDRETARIQHHYLPTVSTIPSVADPKRGNRRMDSTDPMHEAIPVRSRDQRDRHSLAPTLATSNGTSHGQRRSDMNSRSGHDGPSFHVPAPAYPPAERFRGEVSQGHSPRHSSHQAQIPSKEDKRFYRYSSSDVDLTRVGHRLAPASAYRF